MRVETCSPAVALYVLNVLLLYLTHFVRCILQQKDERGFRKTTLNVKGYRSKFIYRVSGLQVYKNTCLCFNTQKLYAIYVFNNVQSNSKRFLCTSVHFNVGTCCSSTDIYTIFKLLPRVYQQVRCYKLNCFNDTLSQISQISNFSPVHNVLNKPPCIIITIIIERLMVTNPEISGARQ